MSDHGYVRALSGISGFRRLLGVRLTSQFGDGLAQASLASSILFNPAQQTSPLKIASGFALLVLPFSVLGPFVGVFLDRWSRRNTLYYANVIRFFVALGAAAVMYSTGPSLAFFMCVLVVTAVNRFFLSGLSASQPPVVPAPMLVTANAISSTLGTAVYSVGLGLTALALNTFLVSTNHGYGIGVAVGAFGYLASAMVARNSFGSDALGPDQGVRRAGSPWAEVMVVARGMIAGAEHLASKRPVFYAMLTQSLCRTLYGVLTLATLLLYSRYFFSSYKAALGGLGAVVVVGSLGAVLAAFITPIGTRQFGGRWWIVAMTLLIVVGLLTLAMPFQPGLLIAATFLLNAASQGTKIVVDTSVQTLCAEHYRGRVFSVNDTVFNIFWIAGLFLGALMLPSNGHSPGAIIAVTAGYAVVAVWYAVASRAYQPVPPQRDRVTAPPTTLPVA